MKNLTLSLALLSALSFGCATTSSGGGAAEPSMEEMMAAWQRAATPGDEHRALDAFVGTWKATVTMYWTPEGEPDVSNGTMTNSWVLDGHHLEQRYEGFAGGAPFKGVGMWGFDVAAGEYYGTWLDTMSTSLMVSSGERSSDGKTFHMTSTNTDPVSGKRAKSEEVIVIESPNRHTMTSYKLDGGERTKSMEIVYERVL
jgi:hypothetical protein